MSPPYLPCHVERTIDLFSGRWKSAIIYHLRAGPQRFNELQRHVPGISQRMLTYQLRRLERDRIVERVEGVDRHVTFYHLTQTGRSLGDVVLAIHKWGRRHESALPENRAVSAYKKRSRAG